MTEQTKEPLGMGILESMGTSVAREVSTGIGVIIGSFLIYAAHQTTKYMRSYKRKNTVKHQIERAVHINALLVEARLKWGAARVYVFQFSNGTYYNNSVSQLNMTCTHQSVTPGVSALSESKKDYLVSQYPEMFSEFMQHHCVGKNIDDIGYPKWRATLMSQGVSSFFASAFTSPRDDKNLEGYVGVDFLDKKIDEVSEEICTELVTFADRIGAELRL